MPIVKVTNHSMANVRPDKQPQIIYHDVSDTQAKLMLAQIKQLWLTHDVCLVNKIGD